SAVGGAETSEGREPDVDGVETRIESDTGVPDPGDAETKIQSADGPSDVDTSETRIESEDDVGGWSEVGITIDETDVENEEVAFKYVDTVIRKAVGDGDIERAETIIDRAAGVYDDADVTAMMTVLERARDGDLEARYRTTIIQRDE
ncbi:MAG: hypothetical protein R3324_03160, partial [Halobacteriales archaeon]|nr:hypothetical protein [Halobacteriales archaeon]